MSAYRTLLTSMICLTVVALLTACQPSPGAPTAVATQPPATATPAPQAPTSTPRPTDTPLPTATPTPRPTPTAAPTPTPALAADVLKQMETIQSQIAEIRGLAKKADLRLDVRDQQGWEQYLQGRLSKEFSKKKEFQQLVTLSVMGLISPTFELRDFYQKMYAEQAVGFYDFENDEMIIPQSAKFDGMARLTYAQGFVEALLDQTFDVDRKLGFNNEKCDENTERCAAIRALIQGDAGLASATWLKTFGTAQDQADVAQAAQRYMEMPVLKNAPLALSEELMFPDTVGTQFVNYLFQQGGWKAVNQAYLDPPVTTEQIMHPERYPADKPQEVTLPDLLPVLGEGWALLDQDTMGEWATLLVLTAGIDPEARLNVNEALPAVTGWGGDTYAVYFNQAKGQSVLVLKTKWETPKDANEFYAALGTHVTARFDLTEQEIEKTKAILGSGIAHAQLQLKDDATFYVLSPSKEMSQAILKALL
jgi:hypothetical protein